MLIKAFDERYDARGSILAELVRLCLENRAKIPPQQRVRYERYVRPEALAYLEHSAERLLFGPKGRFSRHEHHYRIAPSDDHMDRMMQNLR